MGPLDLSAVLRPLEPHVHPDLLVGLHTSDDAAVYRLGDKAIVQTLDFFAPVVDDPYSYGAIAAANAMSDIYAMGGEVLLALNIVAFPDTLPPEILTEILRGGADKVAEAGGVLAGGHTVVDREPKYGLSVTGVIDPTRITTKGGARPGDQLVLTKAIGTGAITTALKGGVAAPEHVDAAVASMLTLNRRASQLFRQLGVVSCTDITGFGLLGHASEMADASAVAFQILAGSVPLLPGALDYAQKGVLPGGLGRNRAYFQAVVAGYQRVQYDDPVPAPLADLLLDPETSGGLLAAVPTGQMPALKALFSQAGVDFWVIGHVHEGRGVRAG
jgi:selenide, water dikinase